LGSSIGFAGSGTAIAGTVPIGLLGSWLGYRYGARVKSAIERICAGDEDPKRDVEKNPDPAPDPSHHDNSDGEDNSTHHERIEDIALGLLAFQLGLAGVEREAISSLSKGVDDWSIAYVWGFEDAFLQWGGRGPDVDGFARMAMIFIKLYGHVEGPKLCGRALRLQEKHHPYGAGGAPAFTDGLMTGGQDAMDWLTSQGKKAPLGWFEHLNEGQ
jgi:hypothetical protein